MRPSKVDVLHISGKTCELRSADDGKVVTRFLSFVWTYNVFPRRICIVCFPAAEEASSIFNTIDSEGIVFTQNIVEVECSRTLAYL